MKTRRRNASEEDSVTKTGVGNTRSKTVSANETEKHRDPIPYDLIIEVLSRLPAKSIAKYRCLSKLWASTILRQDFTDLFLERSSSRPQILFACRDNGEFIFLSSPQPQNPDENSSPLVFNRLTRFSFKGSCEVSGPVHGLVSLLDTRIAKGRKENVVVICNPSTGQSLTLPKVRTRRVGVKSYLVYDPIDKRFKVLSMTWSNNAVNSVFGEHQILSLGTGNKPSWRMIECSVPHYSSDDGICINGVLYYLPLVNDYSDLSMIVRFDVRSEKFRSIGIPEGLSTKVFKGALINYNGKLGLIVTQNRGCVGGGTLKENGSLNIELWVLEDDEKQKWSKNTYVLPALCLNTLRNTYLRFLGMTRTNEVVFSSVAEHIWNHLPCYIFYYSLERNTIVKVGFQGMEGYRNICVAKFLNHVEDVRLMQVF